MAKKSMVEREKKRAYLTKKYAEKRFNLKKELKCATTYDSKLETHGLIQQLPKNSAPIRQKSRCWVTGRSRGFYRAFGLSRHVLREFAHEGKIPGLRKSSW
jgi:small subunit ribosomal protein S14